MSDKHIKIQSTDDEKRSVLSHLSGADKAAELAARIKSLVEHHAQDRGLLAEQVSQLLEENARLKKQILILENNGVLHSQSIDKITKLEKELGLDFSVKE